MHNEKVAENQEGIGHSHGEYSGLSGWLQSTFFKKNNIVYNYVSEPL